MRRSRGFTLIELTYVAAIIAVLAVIAIPAYNDYITEARRLEVPRMSMDIKARANAFYFETGKFPRDNAQLGLPAPDTFNGQYVRSMGFENGVLGVTYDIKGEQETSRYYPAFNPAYPLSPPLWLEESSVTDEEITAGLVIIGLESTRGDEYIY